MAVPMTRFDRLSELDPKFWTADAGVLATIGPDGTPQTTAVWFIMDDDAIHISVNDSTQKYRNLYRNPKCSFLVYLPGSVSCYVEMRGLATLDSDTDRIMLTRVCDKHDADPDRFEPHLGRITISLTPDTINLLDYRN